MINSLSYNPTQPEIKRYSEQYIEYKPNQKQSSGVSLFYQFKVGADQHGILPIIPDGCIDLLFNLHSTNPSAMVAVSPEQRRQDEFIAHTSYFGIRLYPDQGRLFLNCSLEELLHHKRLPLTDVLNFNNSFLEQIVQQNEFKKRISLFTSFLTPANETGYNYDRNLINCCLDIIYLSKGLKTVKELSTETGYSDRYLRKKFAEYIGFSPKEFSQIVRLQYSVNTLIRKPYLLSDIVDKYGYYDKAHFYKDFKKYMFITPKEYLEIINS
ncbi:MULTISPECIES: helix-turn-helix domain-containing protein [Paraliobacillus]|uniref:helix-turn-helix domain-containing protein n=1 Tax=Paraliobacillus TaxID=200903 RepID=UPI000DD41737|nr:MULTISPECIES: helix-turn-helix domain-containing protein [Paraliobacillus]